jgi:hypothetical protein
MKRIHILALIACILTAGAVFASTGRKSGDPPPPPTHMGTGRRIWKPIARKRHRHQGHHRGRNHAMLLPGGKNW